MIVSMRPNASKEEIEAVCSRIREFGYRVHAIQGDERAVIGAVGIGDVTACLESLQAMPGVENAVRISAPYKFVSREFRREPSVIRVNGVEFGGDDFVVIAGPCAVESERQIMETAEFVARAGAKMLRGAPSNRAPRPMISRVSSARASACCARPRRPPAWTS